MCKGQLKRRLDIYVSCSYNILTEHILHNIILHKEGVDITATTNVTMRMDEDLKSQLQELVSNLGMDIPNEETKEAIEEVRRMRQNPSIGKSYTDVDEMMKGLLA